MSSNTPKQDLSALIERISQRPLIMQSSERMVSAFGQRRQTGELSLAHDEAHVMAVTKHGLVVAFSIAEALGQDDEFCNRAAFLTALAGLWHDMCRRSTEKEKHGPEAADMFVEFLAAEVSESDSDLNDKEIALVADAMRHHEGPLSDKLERFGDPVDININGIPEIGEEPHCQQAIILHDAMLRAVVGISLKIADGCLEASGHRVVERRCYFVSRERMIGPHKDVTMLKHPFESDLAWIGEYFVRVYKKLAIGDYPKWLRLLGEKEHTVQYKFVRGLLAFRGMTEVDAVKELRRRGFPGIDDALVTRVKEQQHLSGKWFKEEEFPVLFSEIKGLAFMEPWELEPLAFAARKVVDCICRAKTPEDGIDDLRRFCLEILGSNPPEELDAGTDGTDTGAIYAGIAGYRNAGPEIAAYFHDMITRGIRAVTQPEEDGEFET